MNNERMTEEFPFRKIKFLGQTIVLGGKHGNIDKFTFADGSGQHVTIMLESNPLDVHIKDETTEEYTRIDLAKIITDIGEILEESSTVYTTYKINNNFSMLPVTALTIPFCEGEIKKKELMLYLNPFSIVHTNLEKLNKLNYQLAFGFSGEHLIMCNPNISLIVNIADLHKQFLIYKVTEKAKNWIIS